MKSYKDIDKSIVMNAPEGAMWVACWGGSPIYYKCGSTTDVILLYADGGKWVTSARDLVEVQTIEYFIPLPNVEIPWEATEDSVCPVAEGINIIAREVCGYTHQIKVGATKIIDWSTKPLTSNQIVSYKIIDEEYLLTEDEYLRKEESTTSGKVYTFGLDGSVTVDDELVVCNPEASNQKLIKHLEFLQILANKFPEINAKVVELMEVELDAWWHGTLEERVDE